MASFRDWWVGKLIPSFSANLQMLTYGRAQGDVADSLEYKTDGAIKQRLPTLASKAARGLIGDERKLTRQLNATEAQYATKLRDAWIIYPTAGTPLALLNALRDDGYDTTIITRRGWQYTLSADGTAVVIDKTRAAYIFQNGRTLWNTFALQVNGPFPSGAIPDQAGDEGKAFLAQVEQWRFGNALLGEVVWVPANAITWDTFPADATWDSQDRTTWDNVGDPGAIWTSF